MWFYLFTIAVVIGIGVIKFGMIDWDRKHKFLYWHSDNITIVGSCIVIISSIVASIMLISIVCSHTNVEAKLEQDRETYEALIYKMESTTCRDEFGFLSKEVIDEVQEWNQTVRYRQSAQDNFWSGIFYPNVYDEFKTIDYESYNNG